MQRRQFDFNGDIYDVHEHLDGNFALSRAGSPKPTLFVGSWDDLEKYIKNNIGWPIDWI